MYPVYLFITKNPLRYVDGAAERERLEQEKKEAKLEKLRKVAEVTTTISLEFSN